MKTVTFGHNWLSLLNVINFWTKFSLIGIDDVWKSEWIKTVTIVSFFWILNEAQFVLKLFLNDQMLKRRVNEKVTTLEKCNFKSTIFLVFIVFNCCSVHWYWNSWFIFYIPFTRKASCYWWVSRMTQIEMRVRQTNVLYS